MAAAACQPEAICLMSLHGTGTPLGDPIEVNALGLVLAARAPHRVAIASAKACFGHTEGTAGVHGALAAVLSLQRHSGPPIMHLRQVNPYVASALQEWSTKHGVQPSASREVATLPAAGNALAGCSSFGMSGTNAHGLFAGAPQIMLTRTPKPSLAWQHGRHWPLPACSHMLASSTYDRSGGVCRFQVPLASPQLAFLLDHIVQSTPIMPGAGMLETATAACKTLHSDTSSKLLCLVGAAIPAPVALEVASARVLECQVNCSTGDLQLRSIRGNAAAAQLHFKATARRLATSSTIQEVPDQENKEETILQKSTGAALAWPRVKAVKRAGVRCLAQVDATAAAKAGAGFLGHPAVVDNALQLGPATGDVGKEDDADVTRVVAGISAFAVGERPLYPSSSVSTATERAPMAEDGTIFTTHWLLREGQGHGVHVMDLQAKVINLDSAIGAQSGDAVDRIRLIYDIEWQTNSHIGPLSSGSELGCSIYPPSLLLTSETQAQQAHFAFAQPGVVPEEAQVAASTCLTHTALVQTLMQAAKPGWQLQLQSHGAQPAVAAPSATSAVHPMGSAMALSMMSFMRVAMSEYPTVQWSGLDVQQLQPLTSAFPSQNLAGLIGSSDAYGRVLGQGVAMAPRLLVREPSAKAAKAWNVDPHLVEHLAGSVVITGGMGALGTLMATWLAGLIASSGKLFLLGRSGRTSGDALPTPLYSAMGQIVCARGDVSSAEECADVIYQAGGSPANPFRGLMHAGAVLDSKVISNVSARSIRTEYSGKVFGAEKLLESCATAALGVLQLFSSLASFSGAAGQATYAAANGVLDSWAHQAQSCGRPALAVQWGNWGGGGMAVRNAGFIERMEKMGLGIIDPGVGLNVMARLLGETARGDGVLRAGVHRAVHVGNVFLWDAIVRALPAVPAFLEEFARTAVLDAKHAAAARMQATKPGASRAAAPGAAKRARGRKGARKQRAAVAALPPSASSAVLDTILSIMTNLTGSASAQQPFMDSGVDSLGAVQLRNEIASAFGVELAPTVTFDYPTPDALATYVASQMGEAAQVVVVTQPEEGTATEETAAPSSEPETARVGSDLAASGDTLSSVLSVVESVIGTAISAEDPLMASGLDSLGAVQLRNAIAERFGVELPATAALDFPTPSALASHVASQTGASVLPAGKSMAMSAFEDSEYELVSGVTEIVGVSCIYPGQAAVNGVEGFWASAAECADLPGGVPFSRWDIERHYTPDVTGKLLFQMFALNWRIIESLDGIILVCCFKLTRMRFLHTCSGEDVCSLCSVHPWH